MKSTFIFTLVGLCTHATPLRHYRERRYAPEHTVSNSDHIVNALAYILAQTSKTLIIADLGERSKAITVIANDAGHADFDQENDDEHLSRAKRTQFFTQRSTRYRIDTSLRNSILCHVYGRTKFCEKS